MVELALELAIGVLTRFAALGLLLQRLLLCKPQLLAVALLLVDKLQLRGELVELLLQLDGFRGNTRPDLVVLLSLAFLELLCTALLLAFLRL